MLASNAELPHTHHKPTASESPYRLCIELEQCIVQHTCKADPGKVGKLQVTCQGLNAVEHPDEDKQQSPQTCST